MSDHLTSSATGRNALVDDHAGGPSDATQRNDPPAYSPVTAATVDLTGARFTVTVVAGQTAPWGQESSLRM
jgi:hypothetical protein